MARLVLPHIPAEKVEIPAPLPVPEEPAVSMPEVLDTATAPNEAVIEAAADAVDAVVDATTETRSARGWKRLGKVVGGVALTGYLLFGGGGENQASAEASAGAGLPVAAAQKESTESGIDWGTAIPIGLSIATTGAGIVAFTKQTKENVENRFTSAERNLALLGSKADGEERGASLLALDAYSKRRGYETRVYKNVVEYLRGRRAGLSKLGELHKNDAAAYEHAITERRYADKNAFKIFIKTLPAARKAVRAQGRKERFRRAGSNLSELMELTDSQLDEDPTLVNARGINLDSMRQIKAVDLSGLDLSGARFRSDQLTLINFRGSRLREIRLQDAVVERSDLRGADLRAAYFNGATVENCVIDKDTAFGNIPDNLPESKFGRLDPSRPDDYRGDPNVVLKDLRSDTLSPQEIVHKVHEWRSNGLKLLAGSNDEYFLNPDDNPNRPAPPAPTTS